MKNIRKFLSSGHWPTLFSSFLYFDFCFAVWVLNGAMAPFISEHFNLTPVQKGFMISVPIFSGALMRFPLGLLSQYIGRKNAALLEMGVISAAMLYGYLMISQFSDVIVMGILLGLAGASFGVALSLGAGSFPKEYKGLAMGVAGAGNSGTVLAVLFAPPLAQKFGWQNVYGMAALFMLVPILVMIFMAREPEEREKKKLKDYLKCLTERDGWVFNLMYIVTFGGFIGLSNFLPTFFHDQYQVSKVEAGRLTMYAALVGSGMRVVGGYFSDRIGGVFFLSIVFVNVTIFSLLSSFSPSLYVSLALFMLCFAALGAGNGAVFQLVPLRWPATTAVAGSMIGEIGALGGGIIPNAMGFSKQYMGSFAGGFIVFAVISLAVLVMLRMTQKKWAGVWIDKNGRVLGGTDASEDSGSFDTDQVVLKPS